MRLFGMIALGLAFGFLFAQPQPVSRFEIASVKVVAARPGWPWPEGFSGLPTRAGGRIHWVCDARAMILFAYRLPLWRVSIKHSGGFVALDATTDPGATEEQVRQMVQDLLTERFHLRTHRETRTVDGYVLEQGKSGAKIRPAGDGEKVPPLPDWLGGRSAEARATALAGKCVITAEGGDSALTCRNTTIAQLAETLEQHLGTLVANETGMDGKYYLGLLFARENGKAESDSPDLFGAVEARLGLRLRKHKAPVEFLVVDAFDDAPSGN